MSAKARAAATLRDDVYNIPEELRGVAIQAGLVWLTEKSVADKTFGGSIFGNLALAECLAAVEGSEVVGRLRSTQAVTA